MPVAVPASAETYFDAEYETMPRPEIEALQQELLDETISFAYERSPLVRETWDAIGLKPGDVRSLDDFREKVPFIDKDAVRRYRDERGDPYGGVLCCPEQELTAVMSTSGTTGDPTLVAERWGDGFVGRPALMYRDFWAMGVRPGDYVTLFLFTFRGPTYGFVQSLGATPILLDYGSHEIERLLRLSLRYRPTALYNFGGTMIKATAEVAAACGIDPVEAFASYRGIVFAGEPLGVRARELAAEWSLPLYEHSNVGDVGACFECPAHDGMHVWEDTVLVEGIDPDSGGRSELVATSLVNRVAPLIRFRSDDLVRIERDRCRCGRTHARIWTLGRKSDEVLVQGRSILPIDLWAAIESVKGCELGLFQVVRPARQVDELRVRVGHAAVPEHRLSALAAELAARISDAVGVEPVLDLVPEERLLRMGPPHKIPRVTRR